MTGDRTRALAAAASAALLLTVTACGGGSTVDNAETGTADVPNVSESASASPSESEDPSEDANRSSGSSSTDRTSSGDEARDGGVQPVDEVPQGGQRSEEETAFLDQLKDDGIDLSKESPESRDGLQAQILSAGYQYCGNKDTPLVGVVAGQLQTQGLLGTDDPSDEQVFDRTVKNIHTAAKDHLCGKSN